MIANQKHLFRLDDDVTFLNGAYMSPQLISVEQAGIEAINNLSKPYLFSTNDFFDIVKELKSSFAKLIHCEDPNQVAFMPSVSYGIATVANNISLQKGDEIIILKDQFPSNYYSWKRLADKHDAVIKIIDGSLGKDRAKDWNSNILQAINSKTKLVAMCQVHWAEGIKFDLEAIREKTDQYDAWLVIDGTQSVGAMDFDVNKIRPDALICGGYKWLMGPYGSSVAYYGEKMNNGTPIEENWINRKNSHLFQNLVNYQDNYAEGSGRYSVGEQSNFILLPMLRTAIDQLLEWGVDNIQNYCKALNEPYLDQLENLGFSVLKDDQISNHLLGIQIPDHIDEQRLKQSYLDHKVIVSYRGNAIRISPNVYNTATDWQRLIKATEKAVG